MNISGERTPKHRPRMAGRIGALPPHLTLEALREGNFGGRPRHARECESWAIARNVKSCNGTQTEPQWNLIGTYNGTYIGTYEFTHERRLHPKVRFFNKNPLKSHAGDSCVNS